MTEQGTPAGAAGGTPSASSAVAGNAATEADKLPVTLPGTANEDQPTEGTDAADETDADRERRRARRERQRDRLIRENAELRTRLEMAERGTPRQSDPAPAADDRPKRDDYSDYDEYMSDLSAWKADRRIAERLSKTREQEATRERGQTAEAELARQWQQRTADYAKANPTFNADIRRLPELPRETIAELVSSDLAAEIAHHLARNPDLAEDLADLSPSGQIRMIGRLEGQLQASKGKPLSRAAPPVTPPSGKAAPPVRDPAGMTPAQYRAWREAQK